MPSRQIYLTDFRLRLANIATQPPGTSRYSASIHRLLVAAQIAIDAYEEDVQALVKRQLFTEIGEAVKDRNHADHVRAIERKKNWDVWRKSTHCLSYGTDRSTLEQVVRFSSVTVADVGRGLQKSSRGEWSLDQFAEEVINQAERPTARLFRAPIDLDSWNKELELTCARNFGLQIGTPVGIMVKERCAKNGEKRRTRF